MKNILLLLTILTFTSCIDVYRSDDIFIVTSKEIGTVSYKYLYHTKHCTTSTTGDLFHFEECVFVSNENYELGDTIKFIRYTTNEK